MRLVLLALLVLLLWLQHLQLVAGIRWMALHRATPGLWNVSSSSTLLALPQQQQASGGGSGVWRRALKERFGLTRRQERLCRDSPELLPLLSKAALSALAACQNAFADRRWNCSSLSDAPQLTPDLTQGTREQAFAYALSSAAVAHSVARACAAGALFDCPCADTPREPPNGNFKWGGCGDNVAYGSAVSRRFVDVLERRGRAGRKLGQPDSDDAGFNALPPLSKQRSANVSRRRGDGTKKKRALLALINLHNNRAGRRAVELSLAPQCKCHGVSGSCNIKTCWRALPRVQDVAARLKRRYATATEVALRRRGVAGRRHLQPALQLAATPPQPVNRGMVLLHYGKEDLLYATKSPDYCNPDTRFGSIGTRGRWCNASEAAIHAYDACGSMCCGRGHETRREERLERCHCKYHWCCYVKCKTCRRTVLASHCL